MESKPQYFRACRRTLQLDRTLIMGIVNVTPDSFYDGGRFEDPQAAVAHGLRLVEEGADLLDVGGESSRPGSDPITAEEELRRVLPVITGLRRRLEIPIAVDTWKAPVARAALEAGADLINDISALDWDPQMAPTVASCQAGVILMHIRGRPKTMQQQPFSQNILAEVRQDLERALQRASAHGIAHDRIALDPGIGFGKSLRDNLQILNRLDFLKNFNLPILVGTSRKSFLGQILGVPEEERLWGTAASVAAAILRGADIVRVHDVQPMRMVARVAEAIRGDGRCWSG